MFNRIRILVESTLNNIWSLVFCLRYLPFRQALHCPVRIHYKTKVYISKRAKIHLMGGVTVGVHPGAYALNRRRTRFCIYDDSEIFVGHNCCISRGANVCVRYGGRLYMGSGFFCNSDCNILVNKEIVIDNNVLIGWNVTLLDSDGHTTQSNGIDNVQDKPIHIGEHCWLGANSTILKGVELAADTIIPYGTVIHKSNDDKNVVFANKVLKRNIIRNE